ncbi:hypothetical protein BGW36DRAFT_395003 [Talaromyces proteolyticus]|uniref:Monooxygenase n=1 Tax=Talaromyces proteolyticus TaxID=1131652 RepID=A0AAD4Q441_9EURO|nr:uncharacterized protein BGW36DRAFT_395003 [Talaromyces proteolyticus]KAH8702351.1 hypothetical protein BGW36DRAFT_395003 [Talaromyces proteolyticus]
MKRVRITIIGAGISGILIAFKLQKHLDQYVDICIVEKNPNLGGTWYENRYPGCACDVPSHVYQYSFAPNPEWSQFYATSQEIQRYLKGVAKNFGLERFIKYNSKVIGAQWQEERAVWRVEIEDGRIIESEILINAGGILNNPQTPDIKGLASFAGPMLHTATWDNSVDLHDRRVAVIGAGASAIQLLPQIQSKCSHIDIYIRTPSWISPPVGMPNPDTKNYAYSEEDKDLYRKSGISYLRTRKELENHFNGLFKAFAKSTPEQRDLRNRITKKLIPSFEAGCRRINPGEEYLITLQKSNVTPIFEKIEEITTDGIVTSDSRKHPMDILIMATGFNTTFRPRFPILGRRGINLQELWETTPVSYMGTGVSGFPNYFMFLGPNTPISNGSLMGPLEATGDYFVRLLRKVIRQNVKTFDVRPDVQADFDQHTQQYMQNMVWTGSCRSWFKNHKTGRINALWPGSSLHYMQILAENRWEDYSWGYHHNRFAHWEGGRSWVEDPLADPLGREERISNYATTVPGKDSDLSFYLWESEPLPAASLVDDGYSTSVLDEVKEGQRLNEWLQTSVSASITVPV